MRAHLVGSRPHSGCGAWREFCMRCRSREFLPLVGAVLWAILTTVSFYDSGRSVLTAVCALNLFLHTALVVRGTTQ